MYLYESHLGGYFITEDVEVVGNIYDNPELIKDGE